MPFRSELLLGVGLILALQLLPRRVPLGIYVAGAVSAGPFILNGVALVLVYRANRFANFSQVGVFVLSSMLFDDLVRSQWLLGVVRSACGCVSPQPSGVPVILNTLAALVVALVVGPALGYLLARSVLPRFKNAPRVMLTVFTLFAAQALLTFTDQLHGRLIPPDFDTDLLAARAPRLPWSFSWRIDDFASVYLTDAVMALAVVGTVVGIFLYLRRSNVGTAIRAAAENPARAATVGVDVPRVNARVWLLAGALASFAAVLSVFSGVNQPAPDLGTVEVVLPLVAAVVARFRSFAVLAIAIVVLLVVRLATFYALGSPDLFEAALVVVLGAVLFLQRQTEGRPEREVAGNFDLSRELRRIPAELRHLPEVKRWVRIGSFALAMVVLGLPWALSRSHASVATQFLIFAVVGLSLVVVTGWAGQVSLGQGAFAAVGAWAAAVSGLPFPMPLLVGAVAGAALAVAVGIPVLRTKGLDLAILSFVLAVSVHALFMRGRYLGAWLPATVDRPSLLGMDLRDVRVSYYVNVVIVGAVALAVIGLRRTRTGRAVIAMRVNQANAQSFGLGPLVVRLTAFGIGGFLAGLAGALLVLHVGSVDAGQFVADSSLTWFLMAVVGGLGGVSGAFLGFGTYAILTLVDNPVLGFLAVGVGGMFLVLVAPGGLAQLAQGVRDAALRRLAVRLRIPVPALMGDRAAYAVMDKVQLDVDRRRRAAKSPLPVRYKFGKQWALGRYGTDDDGGRAPAGAGRSGRTP